MFIVHTSFWTWSEWLSPHCFDPCFDRRPRRRMVAGSVGSADEIPCYFLFTWHRSGDPMSCWPTIPIHIICRWCIIRKFTYDVKKAFDGIYVYQSVTKNDISSHTCTPVWFLKQPISRHGELFVNENVDEPMDFGDHQLRPNPGIMV